MMVHTESGSVYELDTDNSTVRRVQGALSDQMRRDEENVRILGIPHPPIVGLPFVMHLDIRQDGVTTIRTTTPVTRVEP